MNYIAVNDNSIHPASTQSVVAQIQPAHFPHQHQHQHHHQHACNPPLSSYNANLPLHEEGDRIAKMRKTDETDEAIRVGVVEKTAEHTVQVQSGPGPGPSCHNTLLQNASVVRSLLYSASANLQRHPEIHNELCIDTISTSSIGQGCDRAQDNQGCMSTAVNNNTNTNTNNEVTTTSFHLSRPAATARLPLAPGLERPTHHNNDHINNPNRPKRSLHCSGFGLGQQNDVVIPSNNVTNNGHENNDGRNSVGESNKNYRKTTSSVKKNVNKKRERVVKAVTEWGIPPGIEDKYGFVVSSLKQGIDPDVVYEHQEKSKSLTSTPSSISKKKIGSKFNKKNKQQEEDPDNTTMVGGRKTIIYPLVTGAEFNNRFLKYKLSPSGNKKKEKLVRSFSISNIPITNCNQAKEAWENNHIEEIPDEPPRSKSSSRVGPRYQARILSKLEDDDAGATIVDTSLLG